MEKEFVPYEVALRLKALGFDEPCFGCYLEFDEFLNIEFTKNQNSFHGQIASAPTFSQAFRWFRKNHDLLGIPTHSKYTIISNKWVGQPLYGNYNSYEESELACLEKLLEICSSK